jgi:ABC-type multidrug transport system ATPase subunit
MMTLVGAVEWWYLFQLTTTREHQTKLEGENSELASPVSVEDDQLIASERQRSMVDDQGINTRDLVKVFEINEGKKKKTKKFKCAVKGLSLGIRKGEIFVLLGPNGAGKTVTMSALASAITPEHGEIVLDGTVVNQSDRNSDKLYKSGNISYCAQFDALFTNKTVIQHFEFFSNIRGLDWHNKLTQDHVGTIMTLLSLEKHQNKTAEELSGGYKRRLCLGLSMVGYPSCCALDEPTTGLDPGARHLVWDVLKPENIAVPAILMCTHYMEEAAALGTRIGIMVDGEFISTGSLNELYERYCTSFFVEISFKTDSNDSELEGSVVQEFEAGGMSASVYESLPYHIKLQVDITDSTREKGTLQLAAIFMLLESKKTKLHIKFYSVAKMNLEQIFINLSRKQFEANEAIELT